MIEALKQALEALENNRQTHHYCEDTWYSCPKHEEGCANDSEGDECNCGADKANIEIDAAITSLRQAIREHAMYEVQRLGQEIEQEPVCEWCDGTGMVDSGGTQPWGEAINIPCRCQHTHPPQLEQNFCSRCGKRTNDIHTCTPPQRKEQEPVAYDKTELNCFAQDLYDQKMREGKRGHYESMFHVIHQCVKKVASPPQRTWVGLTDEEQMTLLKDSDGKTRHWLVWQVEAKLKEKNS